MPQGKIYNVNVERSGGSFLLNGFTTADYTHDAGASTQTTFVKDDVALTANDRYTVKTAYPSTALPATSLTLAQMVLAAQTAIDSLAVPGAPIIGTATTGASQVTVSFTTPASNGGSAITSYTVTSNVGGFTASGSSSPIVVPMAADKTAHTFTVRATNAVGIGSPSAASNSVSAT